MLNKKITSILLATSLFAAMSATPVFASNLDTAAGMNAVRYETKDASESGENDQNSLFDTLVERQEAAEAELEKSARPQIQQQMQQKRLPMRPGTMPRRPRDRKSRKLLKQQLFTLTMQEKRQTSHPQQMTAALWK